MARTWGYIIANGERFESSTELFNFYVANGIDALIDDGGGYYQVNDEFEGLNTRQVHLIAQGQAFEDGWTSQDTVSYLFREDKLDEVLFQEGP